MDSNSTGFKSTDEYIATFPETVRTKLEEMRAIIKAAAPDATETISYNMPAFAQNGNLVYFAAAKNHIGFYPTSTPIPVFAKELAAYDTAKGSIRFPMDKPLPKQLITDIVKFKVTEN
jgi:uncharacterized protein YdhG (YjbR/CyaY superfamily)